MNSDNENIAKNGWSEYGRLVLNELQRLNQGQDELKKDLDAKFLELNAQISEVKTIEKELEEIKEWRERVVEVWSVPQMKQSKDEIYTQKNRWQIVTGIVIAIQVIIGIVVALKDKLF